MKALNESFKFMLTHALKLPYCNEEMGPRRGEGEGMALRNNSMSAMSRCRDRMRLRVDAEMRAAIKRFDTTLLQRILHLSLIDAYSLEEDKMGVRPGAARGYFIHAVIDHFSGELVHVLENLERRREHGEVIWLG